MNAATTALQVAAVYLHRARKQHDVAVQEATFALARKTDAEDRLRDCVSAMDAAVTDYCQDDQ